MRTPTNRQTLLLFGVTLAAWAGPAIAYPPDNAAVLYYKAFMLYKEESDMTSILQDYRKGDVELNDQIETYIEKNRPVIDILLDASRIDDCDWGLDYSQGTELLLPPHHEARRTIWLIAADATLQTERGHYRQGLERCLALCRIARHLNERPLICYIIGTAIKAMAHGSFTRVLSEMPPDVETLQWLQTELAEYEKRPYSIEHVLQWKRDAAIISMSPDKIVAAVQAGLDDGELKNRILERIDKADTSFYADNIAYWNRLMDRVEAAFHKPYPQARAELGELDEKLSADFETYPDATLSACFTPTFQKIYVLSLRLEAQSNALRTAVAVHLSHARTGTLPETLPAGLPNDPYTGKPFAYEKTAEGFVLRCQGKDLNRDRIYPFEYKVRK